MTSPAPTTPAWIVRTVEDLKGAESLDREEVLQTICDKLGYESPTKFPKPSDVRGKSLADITDMLEPFGFGKPVLQGHNNAFTHALWPSVTHGFAKTPSDHRSWLNAMSEIRAKYRSAIVTTSIVIEEILADWEKFEADMAHNDEGALTIEAAHGSRSLRTFIQKIIPVWDVLAEETAKKMVIGITEIEVRRARNIMDQLAKAGKCSPRKILSKAGMTDNRIEGFLHYMKGEDYSGAIAVMGMEVFLTLEDMKDVEQTAKEIIREEKRARRQGRSVAPVVEPVKPPTPEESHAATQDAAKKQMHAMADTVANMVRTNAEQIIEKLGLPKTMVNQAEYEGMKSERDELITQLNACENEKRVAIEAAERAREHEAIAQKNVKDAQTRLDNLLTFIEDKLQDADMLQMAQNILEVKERIGEEQLALLERVVQ